MMEHGTKWLLAWSSDGEQAVLYVDGDPVHTADLGAGQYLETGGVLVFGQDQDTPGGGFVAGQAFQGQLDEIRIYDRALSEDEIRQLMWAANPEITEQYSSGDQSAVTGTSSDPVNTATGSFFHQETDLSVPTRGGLMAFTRCYSSVTAAGAKERETGATHGIKVTKAVGGPAVYGPERLGEQASDGIELRTVGLLAVLACIAGLGLARWLPRWRERGGAETTERA